MGSVSIRIAYNRKHVSRIVKVEEDLTGIKVTFLITGFGGRLFQAMWRRFEMMYVDTPPTPHLADPKVTCCWSHPYKPIPEHGELDAPPKPALGVSGDLFLSKQYCLENHIDFDPKEKWQTYLASRDNAKFVPTACAVFGWALMFSFKNAPGLTFFLNPNDRRFAEPLGELDLPTDPFEGVYQEVGLPISNEFLVQNGLCSNLEQCSDWQPKLSREWLNAAVPRPTI